MPDKETIGRRLRELRGVWRSQQDVADATGIARDRISRYETGAVIPPDADKVKLAHYYGETVQDIFFT